MSVELKALVSSYVAGMRQAQQATSDFASKASKQISAHSAELSSLGTGMALTGAAVVLGVGKIVSSYAEFDKAMSQVSATGDDAKASLDDLRRSAIKAGADTMYSATEAAQGITALLKAGVAAKDVLAGGLAGALNLAASGQMDVASAAETTATALNQFGLSGDQASHVADLLAKGANTAQGEVSDMAMALAQGGLVAHQTGLSIEETVGALTMFAKAGLMGSDAGTSLKTMLQRLTPQSEEARKKFQELGISAYDSQGNFVGLTNFAGQLHDRLKGLTPEARNAALQVMFGSDAVRGASVLYEQGAAGAQKFTDAINEQGFAQRQAAELTNNLSGDLERLGGSLDTVFIQSGSGANTVLRQMAQGAESLVDAVGQVPAPLLSILTLITGAGGLATLGVGGMLKLVSVVSDAADSFKSLKISASTARLAVGGVGAAIAVGTLAISAWAEAQATAKQNTDDFAATLVVVGDRVVRTDATMEEFNRKLVDTKVGMFDWAGAGPTINDTMIKMGVSARDAQQYLEGNADAIARVKAAQDAYTSAHMNVSGWEASTFNLTGSLDELKSSLTEAERATLAKAQADREAGVGASTYADALDKSTASTDAASNSLKDYAKQLFESANTALKASGTQIGWEAALDDTAAAIKKVGEAHRLENGQLDLNTAKGRQNQQSLNQLAQSSVAYTQSLIEQGASEERIKEAMERSRTAFIKQATAAGMSKTAAKALADQYGLIPSDVSTDIKVTGGDRSATKLAMVQAAIADLPAEQKVEVLSAFDKGGIEAADKALKAISGKHVTAYVDVQAKYVDTYNRKRQGGPKLADGGLLEGVIQRFASGGSWGQPQVRPFQGSAGVNWGEQGSGPWEAFISGAPQKRDRSIAIWREVGRRLLGSFSAADVMAGFADGGIAEPTWKGQTLSYWQDQMKTDLELTRLRISIRDLKKDLAERETYNPPGKRKKATRLKLRGLDRTEAQQELTADQNELSLAVLAAKLNSSKAGTIEAQLAAWKAADEKSQQDAAAAEQTASESAANSEKWMQQYMTGSSFADLLNNMNAGASSLADFQNGLARLQNQGLNQTVLDWLASTGSASLLDDVISKGKAGIDALNGVTGNLSTAAGALGQAQATSNYTAAPVLNRVNLPGYLQSGASGASVGNTYSPVFQITQSDPEAVAVAVDQKLRYL